MFPISFSQQLRWYAVLFLWLVFLCSYTNAQNTALRMDDKEIEVRIDSLSKVVEPDEQTLQTISDFKDTLRMRKSAEAEQAKIEDYLKRAKAAPKDLEVLSTQEVSVPEFEIPKDATLDEAATQRAMAEAFLKEAKAEEERHALVGKERSARQASLPGLIAETESGLKGIEIPAPPLATAPAAEIATYQRAIAQRQLLQIQVEALKAEVIFLEATPSLFAAQAGLLARKVAAISEKLADLQKNVEEKRLATASDEVQKAKQDVERFTADPKKEEIAREILALAERHGGEGGFGEKLSNRRAELTRLKARLDRVSGQFSGARKRVELLEEVDLRIDADTGRLLRNQRQKLPVAGVLRGQLKQTIEESAQTQIDLLVLEDRYESLLTRRLPDPAVDPDLSALWKGRFSGLEKLISDHREHIKLLRNTTTAISSLMEVSNEFALFVDRRLLWIPSTEIIRVDELKIELAAIQNLIRKKPHDIILKSIQRNYPVWILLGAVLGFLILKRRFFRKRLRELSGQAARRNCYSFLPTVKALFYSLLLAAPIPLLFWALFWAAQGGEEGVIIGLRSIAAFFTFAIFIRILSHNEGVLTDHFRMQKRRVAIIRKGLNWYILVLPTFLFLAMCLPYNPVTSADGRFSFIAVVLILLVFFEQILRPSKRLIQWQGKASRGFALFWYCLGISVPFGLIVGAVMGFYASVQEIRIQSVMSFGIVLITLFVASLLYRLILVSRRRFVVEQALKRRAMVLAERENKEVQPGEKPQNLESIDEIRSNAGRKVVEVEEQTVRLVRAAAIAAVVFGLMGIWYSAVPALSSLDRIPLWGDTVQATSTEGSSGGGSMLTNPMAAVTGSSSSSGSVENVNETSSKVITLQDVFVALITLFLTVVAARNVPGLLELGVFRYLNLAPGSSFAFTTTIRYVLVVIGVILAFGMIGINWGNVQWIAAAITLGIGFGLQEIFANFVAGLIILFERPIRLGDVVTVGNVDGKVTQIRIRATTILQFNNRELIVPNKEFITGQLINWTLSDSVLRFDVLVGIAYGSDTALAKELLLKAASENKRVLDDPEPTVIFDEFGGSSLSFLLRSYVSAVEDLLVAKSELHFAVDQAFREAGIEISFPQQDIHIRSIAKTISTEDVKKIEEAI